MQAVLASILVMSIMLALFVYESVHRELTDVALMRRESVANLAATTLSEKFARLADIGVSLATRVRFRQLVGEGRWAEAIEILRGVPRDLPVIDRVFLSDAQGTLMADFPELAGVRGQNFAQRDWYKGVLRSHGPYVSQVYTRSAVPKVDVFAVAVPIPKEGGGLAGVLVLQVLLDSNFFTWTQEIDVGPEGGAYIVDQNGQVAFDSTSRTRRISDASVLSAVQKVRQGKEGVFISTDPAGKGETILAYAGVEPYGWGVVMHQPGRTSIGLVARDHQLQRLLVAYGLLLLLGLSMVYLSYRMVVQRRHAREGRLVKAELERCVAERTAQLQASNEELEAFSYSVSHDLRGPLRSMDGFSLVLIEDFADKLGEEGKDALERIRAASQRMGHLIDDLLRLSHVTRSELKLTQVDLSATARDIARALMTEHPDRTVECSIESGLVARADPALMRIALQNLLQNAWKFTRLTATPAIRVGVLHRDGQVIYFVADNGAGFDMAHAENLFGAFQRLHHVADYPGSGIGLAIVRRIIRRHEGDVWAEAKQGEGATFFFTVKEAEGKSP